MAMLDVKDLDVYYGKIHAIKKISLSVEKGELVALIGANGAGKTSLRGTADPRNRHHGDREKRYDDGPRGKKSFPENIGYG